MSILVAPNSFKECASSILISEIICNSIKAKLPTESILKYPLTDGGDGFRETIEYYSKENSITYYLSIGKGDNLKSIPVTYLPESKSIFIESAEIIGLKVTGLENRKPINSNTSYLGSILLKLAHSPDYPINELYVGIGGTSTIDFGIGACSQFGLKLFDESGSILESIPVNYSKTKRVGLPEINVPFQIFCITDVDTPLLGENSSIYLYGYQKGADKKDLDNIYLGIHNLINLIQSKKNLNIDSINGAGGGLAAGLEIFLGAKLIPNQKFVNEFCFRDLDFSKITSVITGEGSFDIQSFEGKVTGQLIKRFSGNNVKIFLICGKIDDEVKPLIPNNVIPIQISDYFSSTQESITHFEEGLSKSVNIIADHLKL